MKTSFFFTLKRCQPKISTQISNFACICEKHKTKLMQFVVGLHSQNIHQRRPCTYFIRVSFFRFDISTQ